MIARKMAIFWIIFTMMLICQSTGNAQDCRTKAGEFGTCVRLFHCNLAKRTTDLEICYTSKLRGICCPNVFPSQPDQVVPDQGCITEKGEQGTCKSLFKCSPRPLVPFTLCYLKNGPRRVCCPLEK